MINLNMTEYLDIETCSLPWTTDLRRQTSNQMNGAAKQMKQ